MTTEDPIAAYQGALKKYETAKREVERMVSLIGEVSAALNQDWKLFSVSNSGVNFPVAILGGPSLNADNWPDAKRLAQTLSSWHTIRHELGNAYQRIPGSQRGVITPPPETR